MCRISISYYKCHDLIDSYLLMFLSFNIYKLIEVRTNYQHNHGKVGFNFVCLRNHNALKIIS